MENTQALVKQPGTPQIALLILFAVLDSINAAGVQGAPNGVIYSALMAFGATLDQHTKLITFLKDQGYVIERAHVLFLTDAGRKMLDKLAPLSK